MGFENIALARDLLYLTGALWGAVLGCILCMFKGTISLRSRDRLISLAICTASLGIVALAGLLICAPKTGFSPRPFLAPAGICVLAAAAALYFPRVVAFPLVLLGGCAVVWVGLFFLGFPVIDPAGAPLASVFRTGDRVVSVSLSPGAGYGPAEGIQAEGEGRPLRFSAAVITFDERYPCIGGERRGVLVEIRQDDRLFFADPRLEKGVLGSFYNSGLFRSGQGPLGLSFRRYSGDLSVQTIPPGINFMVFFDGTAFSFSPSRHK
jgi:hypothetical protein